MKKYASLAFVFCLLFNMSVKSQSKTEPLVNKGEQKELRNDKKPAVTPEMRAQKMAQELELTKAEKEKVLELFSNHDLKRAQYQAEIKKFRAERELQIESERKAMRANLEKIIGTEKFQKFEQIKTERMAKLKTMRNKQAMPLKAKIAHRNPENKPSMTPEKMAEFISKKLELSENEKLKVQALFVKQNAERIQQQAEMKKLKEIQMSKANTSRAKHDKELKEIIGALKFEKLAAMRDTGLQKMKQNGKRQNAGKEK